MAHITRFGAFAGVIAAASMTISPAQAATQTTPVGTVGYATSVHADFAQGAFGGSTFEEQAETADYRGRRYRGRRGYRRGNGILAGILVIGGIAAIASAANNNRRRDREVVVVERDRDDRRVDDRRSNPRASNGSGIDNAVSQCLTEIERDVRVDSVDGASRLPQGWVVSGTLFNGSGFTCQIDNNGRTSNIDYNGFSGSSYNDADGVDRAGVGQLTDGRYADARAAMRGNGAGQAYNAPALQSPEPQGPLPAYPGGPLPGETFSE